MPLLLAHDVHSGGDGRAVVLLGALGAHRSMWDGVAQAIAADGRVAISMDLRGLGDSAVPSGPYRVAELAEDVLHTALSLGHRVVDVVGISLGGAVAQELAIEHPDRVGALVLIATQPRFGTPEAWAERAAHVRSVGTAPLATGLEGKWVTAARAAADPALVARLATMVSATSVEGYAANAEALGDFDARDRLSRVVAPTLVLGGEEDPGLPPAVTAAVAAAIPGARHRTIAAAHLVPAERPAETAAAVLEHLRTSSST